ncbi:MAG: PAS domain S-box protein [bacterium]|nr:PAS domain S-box protein [Candidatus Kapabacteria bacterium]
MDVKSIATSDESQTPADAIGQLQQSSLGEILDGITDGFFAIDNNHRFVHFNRRAEEFFGLRRTDVLGARFEDALPNVQTTVFADAIFQSLNDRVHRSLEAMSTIRPDRWIELRVYPSEQFVSVYFADVTERKHIEDELRHSQERYRRFVEQSTEAIWRIELDESIPTSLPVDEQIELMYVHSYLAECNDAMAMMYGLDDPSQMVGLRLGDLLVRENPANVEYLRAFVNSAYQLANAESHERAADGSPRVFANNLLGIIEDGRLVRAWGTQRDITKQHRAEEELRRSEERFRLAVEAAELGPWEFNIRTGEVHWSTNLERIHGLEPGTFGGTFDDYRSDMHPEDVDRVLGSIKSAIESGSDHNVEYRIIRPDGAERWVLGRGRVYFDASGAPLRMTGVCLDITENKRIELQRERLLESERVAPSESERANRIKDEFLSTLSHELRTPLNAILGWSDLMRGSQLTDDEFATGVDVIQRNARMQAQIVEDLLDMSRIISGRMRLEVTSIDFTRVIDSAMETVRPAADARGVQLRKSIDASVAIIIGDENRLQQVIWNLLSNAVKFTPRDGVVSLELQRSENGISLAIVDSGEGIHPDMIAQIFERFRQADSSTTRRHGGLGLGLAISKSIVELHGGTLHASSDGPGMGSMFTIELPTSTQMSIVPQDPLPLPSAPSDHQNQFARPDLIGCSAIVLDDDDDGRDVVRRILEESGVTVRVAGTAHEALEFIAAHVPDIVISDIGMPRVDGYDFMRLLRSSTPERGSAVPAIALTAFARADDRARALAAGYQQHAAKPIEPSTLLALVRELIPSR